VKIPDIRQQLSRKEMERVTVMAMDDGGPFVITKIDKLGGRKEVTVKYTNTKRTKVLILDPVLH
jgi:hypothetical protein